MKLKTYNSKNSKMPILTDIEKGILHRPGKYHKENLLSSISEVYEIFTSLKKDRLSPKIEQLLFENAKDDHSRSQFYKQKKEIIIAVIYYNLLYVPFLCVGAIRVSVFGNKIDISIFISRTTGTQVKKLYPLLKQPHDGMLVYRGLHTFLGQTFQFVNLGLQIECKHFLDYRSQTDSDHLYFSNLISKADKYKFVVLHGSVLKGLIEYQPRLKINKIEISFVASAELLANFIPDFMMLDGPNIDLLHQHYQEYCQNWENFHHSVQTMYSLQEFVHLIAIGFHQQGIWHDFLCRDLYDPRLLILIMSFTRKSIASARVNWSTQKLYSYSPQIDESW